MTTHSTRSQNCMEEAPCQHNEGNNSQLQGSQGSPEPRQKVYFYESNVEYQFFSFPRTAVTLGYCPGTRSAWRDWVKGSLLCLVWALREHVCVCVCVCLCMYGCMCVCVYMWYVGACVCICVCACVCICIYACVWVCMCVGVCVCVCIHICLCVCVTVPGQEGFPPRPSPPLLSWSWNILKIR